MNTQEQIKLIESEYEAAKEVGDFESMAEIECILDDLYNELAGSDESED